IGNFDGVHRGHQFVIGVTRDIARASGATVGILTFEPHPRTVFAPDAEPFRLTPSPVKRRHLEVLKVDMMIELTFDMALAEVPARQFVEDLVVGVIKPSALVVGWDFCFGQGRRGNAKLLREMGNELDFGVHIIEPVRDPEEETYSSNLIRQYLARGEPARAASLLGHLWEIEGEVLAGEELGRTLGFPTANLSLDGYLLPKFGIYAVRAGEDKGLETQWRDGVGYIGLRPTVGGKTPLLEFNLFDFDGDLYGSHWRVALVEFIRGDEKFDDLDALQAQMADDARRARQLLSARRIRAGSVGADPENGGQNPH
ncbi:MAG: bifunctional riboflavin kinase/FAD synthetase, partial [Alphaproteobacteria bacterium]|nr:bifunctional riboflavin kinase/FAD synthetase [Alphaproteobacteria bacterium]